jgi:protein-S-isoprenylcysteine O-methyltransferase Ste14
MHISRYQRLFGVGPTGLLIGLAILGVLWLADRIWFHVEISSQPMTVRFIGFCFIGIWICWHVWSSMTISQWWRHGHLCTKGPYQLVRHPIYAGAALLACPGISLMFNSWIMLLLPVLVFVAYSILVRKEESMMTATFGDEYQHYAARTGSLFPRFF